MQITNTSPHPIYIADHGLCPPGEPIEVPDPIARELIARGNFIKTPVKRPTRPRQDRRAN